MLLKAFYRQKLLFRIQLFFTFTLLCGTVNADQASRPDWTYHQDRIVIGGDIMHLGIGEGDSAEVARFKAEAMSIKGIISECSLAHKDIVIWDRHIEQNSGKYTAYIRAGLSTQSCQEAKDAKGERRKNLANLELMKDQETYSELEGLSSLALKNSKDISANGKQINLLNEQNSTHQQQIKRLEEKIIALERTRSEKSQTIIVKEKEVKILYDKAPANQIRYNDCMEEYQQLMQDARQTAFDIGTPKGNLASPGVYPKLNRAEAKLRSCNQIKVGKK